MNSHPCKEVVHLLPSLKAFVIHFPSVLLSSQVLSSTLASPGVHWASKMLEPKYYKSRYTFIK